MPNMKSVVSAVPAPRGSLRDSDRPVVDRLAALSLEIATTLEKIEQGANARHSNNFSSYLPEMVDEIEQETAAQIEQEAARIKQETAAHNQPQPDLSPFNQD